MCTKYKYIYGPVSSWRLGSSLGVDPISKEEKICTFDCLYCQIGDTKVFSDKRKVFVPVKEIIEEIKSFSDVKIDYITLSGNGEPTLAKNLGEIIKEIKKIRKEKVAVITNSSLIYKKDVQDDLKLADLVMCKLDVSSEDSFVKINRPIKTIIFNKVLEGIREFKANYKGKLTLQIMFIKENKLFAEELSKIAKEINPDEIQINTPLRECRKKPLSRRDIDVIKKHFEDMKVVSVYDAIKKEVKPMDGTNILKRRKKF